MALRSTGAALLIAALLSACVAAPARSAQAALALGDSITVGAAAQLEAAGLEVDAEVGRSFSRGLAILRARGSSLPGRILVNLGTNSGVSRSQCDQLLSIVGSGRALTLVTVNIPAAPKTAATSNAVLADCAARGGATLLDWAGYVAAHPGVVCADGIHISCGGAGEYARFVLSGSGRAPAPAGPESRSPEAAKPGAPAAGAAAPGVRAAQRDAADQAARAEREHAAAAQAAAAAAAEAARLAAEAARLAAERQRRLDYLHLIDAPQPVRLPGGTGSAGSYEFVPVAVRLSLLANS